MAFCPHCGQQVAEQASKCIACGKEFEPKAKAARFKGTMMMAPGSGPEAASAAAAGAKPAVAKEPPKPVAQTAPAAPAPKPAAPPSSKVMKATMLGTGGAGLAPPPGRPAAAGASAPGAPPKAAPPPAAGAWASAAISPAAAKEPTAAKEEPAPPTARANLAEQAQAAHNASGSEPEPREDSQRFLVGDPMAPGSPPAQAERRGSRGSSMDELPVDPTAKLLAIGVGGIVVIATVGYLAARFMGLLN